MIWVLSESIGALALVPLGLLFKPHYLLRHRNPRLLFESLLTLAITLTLSWLSMLYLPWPFTFIIVLLMWSAVRLPRMEAFLISCDDGDDGVADDGRGSLPACYAAYVPDEPYAVATVFADPAARQHHDHGDVCLCAERKHISESETRFRNAMDIPPSAWH